MLLPLLVSVLVMPSDAATFRKRGFEVLEQIRREYYLPESKLYANEVDVSGKKSGPCFNWGTGVLLSALNAAAKLDRKYRPWLREYADASRVYWNEKGPVPGYDVLPGPKDVDRYYDDNAWMVLALVETHEILGDKKYLDWAEQTLDYVLSGWDEKLGGGIYWHENNKVSKNTCSNAPSAAACLAVGSFRRTEELAGWAERILDWTRAKFQDPADLLFWDNLTVSEKLDRTKWSYNTGLFLRASVMRDKRSDSDKHGLKKVVLSASEHWFDPESGTLKDEGRFAHLLIEGLYFAAPDDVSLRRKRAKALDWVYANVRNPQGRYGHHWGRAAGEQKKFELIDQASAARGFLFAAQH